MAMTVHAAPATAERASGGAAEERAYLPTDLLDAVRGGAALYVVLYHARKVLLITLPAVMMLGLHGFVRAEVIAALVTRYGRAAVLAFFVVSGYAIHYRQAHRLAAGRANVIAWLDFARHRARRLYPPLVVALLLTVGLDTLGARINSAFYSGGLGGDLGYIHGVVLPGSLPALLGALAFLQGLATPIPGTDYPLWSLAYEGFYYLTYPLTLTLNARLGPARTLLLFLMVGLACGIGSRGGNGSPLWPVGMDWPVWVGGMVLADARAGRVRLPNRWWLAMGLAGLALLGLLALGLLSKSSAATEEPMLNLLWAPAWFGVIAGLVAARHTRRIGAALTALLRPLLPLGAMSYSLYVVHDPVLHFVAALWYRSGRTAPQTPLPLLAAVALALAVAYGVYLVAERPFLSRRRMPAEEQKARPASASVGMGVL